MRLRPSTEARRTELTVLPMVNVVFLLLIFFMLVGRIAPFDELDVTPPISESGEYESGNPARIVIGADGSMMMNGQAVDVTALVVLAADRVRANPGAHFQLKADANLEANQLIRIMEILRQTGVEQLTLLTENKR